MKNPILIKNIPQKGFACFFGDDAGKKLLEFNAKGELSWQKKIDIQADNFHMLTSGSDIYLLTGNNHVAIRGWAAVNNEGDYALSTYHYDGTTAATHFELMDEGGNKLKVLKFDNDPVTGKPYIAGCIIDANKEYKNTSGRELSKGPYLGVFTIDINGSNPKAFKKAFTYWSDGSVSGVSERGLFAETDSYVMFTNAFRDFDGNTYFAGPQMIKKTRWGCIVSSVITAPLIVPPIWILGGVGLTKCKITDAMLAKQDAKGEFSVENSIPTDHSRYFRGGNAVAYFDNKKFYTVYDSDTKADYLILDDEKNITIYNVSKKQEVRTIPHKDGNLKTSIYPAKEGHVMVSQYNKKEKSTSVSIEFL